MVERLDRVIVDVVTFTASAVWVFVEMTDTPDDLFTIAVAGVLVLSPLIVASLLAHTEFADGGRGWSLALAQVFMGGTFVAVVMLLAYVAETDGQGGAALLIVPVVGWAVLTAIVVARRLE